MKKIILVGLFASLLFSCKTDQKKEAAPAEKQEVTDQKFGDLQALPKTLMQTLFEETTYIDYIFYNLPFSVSQDDRPSILSNLNLMAVEKLGPISVNCKPMGREFFHIGGNIAFEADIYFQDGCFGYVFLDKEKPIFANKVSKEGAQFYSNMINQAEQIKNNTLKGGG